jgi:hypothetical protein
MSRRPSRDQDARLAYAARHLQLSAPFTVESLRKSLENYSGREVLLTPFSVRSGEPSGIFLQTAGVDNLCYQMQTSPFHQAHIVAYLVAQALLSDPSQPTMDSRLAPGVGAHFARFVLGYNAALPEVASDGQAEAFAMRLLDQAGVCECPGHGGEAPAPGAGTAACSTG